MAPIGSSSYLGESQSVSLQTFCRIAFPANPYFDKNLKNGVSLTSFVVELSRLESVPLLNMYQINKGEDMKTLATIARQFAPCDRK